MTRSEFRPLSWSRFPIRTDKRVPNLFYVFNLKATFFFFFPRGMDRDSPSCTHTDPEETCQGVRSRATDPDLPVSLASLLDPDSQHWGRKTAHFTSSGHRSPSTSHAPRQDCVWGQGMNLFFNHRDFCPPFYQTRRRDAHRSGGSLLLRRLPGSTG